jgi:hypothetical protein
MQIPLAGLQKKGNGCQGRGLAYRGVDCLDNRTESGVKKQTGVEEQWKSSGRANGQAAMSFVDTMRAADLTLRGNRVNPPAATDMRLTRRYRQQGQWVCVCGGGWMVRPCALPRRRAHACVPSRRCQRRQPTTHRCAGGWAPARTALRQLVPGFPSLAATHAGPILYFLQAQTRAEVTVRGVPTVAMRKSIRHVRGQRDRSFAHTNDPRHIVTRARRLRQETNTGIHEFQRDQQALVLSLREVEASTAQGTTHLRH